MDTRKNRHENSDFSKTKFAAKAGLAGMAMDIGTDISTNAAAFWKGNKDKVKNIDGIVNKAKTLARTPEAKAVSKQLADQQKGALALSAAFAAGTTALAYKDDLKKSKLNGGNTMSKQAESQEKVAATTGGMASIPGTPDWIKSKGGKK